MASPIRLTYTARRGAEGMGIDAKAGVIVGLVPGGSAEQDRLALVGDEVTAVDGISLVGRRLGELLPAQTGASCELTVTRTDEMLFELEDKWRKIADEKGVDFECFCAREGMEVDLDQATVIPPRP